MSDQSETVISWRAIGARSPVVASDGVEVGRVSEVAALPEEDIFHGVAFTHHLLGHQFLAPADDIDRITERAVRLEAPRLEGLLGVGIPTPRPIRYGLYGFPRLGVGS